MKKLMVAVAVACAAAMVQAAAVTWNSGTIKIASDAKGTTGTQSANTTTRLVNAYCFNLADSKAYEAALLMDTATLFDTYFKIDDTTKAITAKSTPAKSGSTNGGGSAALQVTYDDNSTAYAVLFYIDTLNANLGDKAGFVKAAVVTKDVGTTTASYANAISGSQSSTWTAVPVPEPTSGLLLLLGVAGMALRRRRA